MANDPNNSDNNNSPNELSSIRSIGKDLAERLKHRPKEELGLRERIVYNQMLQQVPPDLLKSLKSTPNMKTVEQRLGRDTSKLRSEVFSDIERTNLQFARIMEQMFTESSVNSLARDIRYTEGVSKMSSTMSEYSWEAMQGRRESLYGELSNIQRQAKKLGHQVFTGRTMTSPNQYGREDIYRQLESFEYRKGGIAQELAAISRQETQRKIEGTDPRSREDVAMRYRAEAFKQARIDEIKAAGGISVRDPESGGDKFVRLGDAAKELSEEMKKLTQDMKDLSSATDEEAEKIHKRIDARIEKSEKLREVSQFGQSGYERAYSMASIASKTFGILGGGAQELMINQRFREVQNISGAAGIANQQYDMYRAARSGDVMSALTLLNLGGAQDFSNEMGGAVNTVQAAQGLDVLAQGVGGGAKIGAGGIGSLGGLITGNIGQNTKIAMEGAQDVLGAAVQGTILATDVSKGLTKRATQQQAVSARTQAFQALSYVGAQQMQGLRDFYTNADVAAQGAGLGANAFINQSVSAGNLNRMAAAGISPEQFAQMSNLGFQQIGSVFDTEQIYAARGMERTGFGSMQQNMQRMATLSSAGSNNPREGMENVLAAAMEKGLDKSKSLSMLVDNTAQMVATSAGAVVGIDTTKDISNMLAASVNPNMENKEMALQRARTAAEITKDITTNRDVSFTGMINTAGLQRSLQAVKVDIGTTGAAAIQDVDVGTLRGLQRDSKKAVAFFQDRGVNITEANTDKALKAMLEEKQVQLMTKVAMPLGLDVSAMVSGMRAGTLSEDQKRLIAQGAHLVGGYTGYKEFEREFKGITEPNVMTDKAKEKMEGKGEGEKIAADLLRTGGFSQLSEAASSAAENLKKFGGALQTFTELDKAMREGGPEKENKFRTAGAEMAADFRAAAVEFKAATVSYATASKEMAIAAGLISNGMAWVPQFVTDMTSKEQQRSKGAPSGRD